MHVELAADLVDLDSTEHLVLLAILAHGYAERHRIITEDSTALEAFTAWVKELDDLVLREEVSLVLEDGERKAVTGTSKTVLRVARDESGVSPSDALVILGYPFRVMLENGRTDRDCVLSFTDSATRRELEDAEERGWLLFETAGGIGEVVKRLEEADSIGVGNAVVKRSYFLVDSDARAPDEPSADARKVADLLSSIETKHGLSERSLGHVLTRRAIENYLPLDDFKRWVCRELAGKQPHDVIERWKTHAKSEHRGAMDKAGEPRSYERALLAILALIGARDAGKSEIIDHYDFSLGHGRGGGGALRTDDSIWSQLDALEQSVLGDGLSKKTIREFFAQATGLRNIEITGLIDTIRERL